MPPVRPQLKPALRRIWRDGSTLQLGLDPDGAVVIAGMDERQARLVERFDGTAEVGALRRTAERMGLVGTVVDDLVTLLGRSGALQDSSAERSGGVRLDPAERDRLAPDIAAASLATDTSGEHVLARRQRAVVTVHGGGRVGATVANLLAAAGVGTVSTEDAAATRAADLAPAGLGPDDLGARRQDGVTRTLRRLAPSTRTHLPAGRASADLAVLTSDSGWTDPRLGDRLVRSGLPHLVAVVRETTGVVGPFVLPGRTSCQRCHELHRTDRDPAWPSISAQLSGGSRGTDPCDVVLATSVAASASLMALAFLDRDARTADLPLAADGTVEIAQASGRVRRRSWPQHPSCGCGWVPDALGL